MREKGIEEQIKETLDAYLDFYIALSKTRFFDLPFYKREQVVEKRNMLASQLREAFEIKTKECKKER